MEILAVIPARGGSKRIPKKNLALLCGKPLIYYTISAAKKSKMITRIVVSTDDKEIKEISKKYGVEVIIRPEELCKPEVPAHAAVEHVVNYLREKEDYQPDVVVLLQPTSPLRTSEDIDNAIDLLISNKDVDSVFSVTEFEHPPFWAVKIENGFIKPFFPEMLKNTELLPKAFRPNGAIGVMWTKKFLKKKKFITDNTLAYIMPRERSADVDEELDLKFIRVLLCGD